MNTHTLRLNRVRLEPLTPQHETGLREAVCDGNIWELLVTTAPAPDQVAAYIQTALQTRTAFAVIDEDSGRVVGSTSLYNTDPAVPRPTSATPGTPAPRSAPASTPAANSCC